MRLLRLWTLVLVLGCSAPVSADILSVDGCADQYAIAFLGDPSEVVLSPDANASWSYYRAHSAPFRRVSPRAEALIAQHPDKLVSQYGLDSFAREFLVALGVEVVDLPWSATLDDAIKSSQGFCETHTDKAELCALARPPKPSQATLTALYITPSGVTAGQGTFVHDLLKRAGLINYEARTGWHTIPLERLAINVPPDLIITAFFDDAMAHTSGWSAAYHPIIDGLLRDIPRINIDGASVSCNAWYAGDAVARLADAASGLVDAR